MTELKQCNHCGKEFPATTEYFHKTPKYNSKDGLRGICKECRKKKTHKYRIKYRKELLEKAVIYHEKNKKKINLRRREQLYKITTSELVKILKEQDYKCKICGNLMEKFCVDHNHENHVVRGILCNNCNSVLGFANDDIQILKNAIIYLENSDKCEVIGLQKSC